VLKCHVPSYPSGLLKMGYFTWSFLERFLFESQLLGICQLLVILLDNKLLIVV
jgi:hypothetical protein